MSFSLPRISSVHRTDFEQQQRREHSAGGGGRFLDVLPLELKALPEKNQPSACRALPWVVPEDGIDFDLQEALPFQAAQPATAPGTS